MRQFIRDKIDMDRFHQQSQSHQMNGSGGVDLYRGGQQQQQAQPATGVKSKDELLKVDVEDYKRQMRLRYEAQQKEHEEQMAKLKASRGLSKEKETFMIMKTMLKRNPVKHGAVQLKTPRMADWQKQWLVCVYNVLIWYNISSEGFSEKPQGYVELENLDPNKDVIQLTVPAFTIPSKDGAILVKLDNTNVRDEWVRLIKQHIAYLNQQCANIPPWTNPDISALEEAIRIFPKPFRLLRENQLSATDDCTPALNDWIDRMRMCRQEWPRLAPQMHKSRFLIDSYVHVTDPVGFLDWLAGRDPKTPGFGGVLREMDESEASVMPFLERTILKHTEAVEVSLEQRYFREDVEKVVRIARLTAVFINCYHRYIEEVLNRPNEKRFQRQQQVIQMAIQIFDKLPNSSLMQKLNFDECEGEVNSQHERWVFTREGVLGTEGLEFHFNGFNVASDQDLYGGVLWNNFHWVWFHPHLAFFVRYNFDRQNGAFHYHVSKQPKPGERLLPTWEVQGNALVPIFGANESSHGLGPIQFTGKVPLPIVLLVALMPHFDDLVQQLQESLQPAPAPQ